MPTSQARPGFGCLFQVGDGASPEVFTSQAEVVDVPGFGYTHLTADVTHMTSEGWVEHIKLGLKESKPFTLPLNFVADSVSQIALYQTRATGTAAHNYRIKFTDVGESTVTFSALVTDVDITHAQRNKAEASIQFTPTGGYTWA